MTTTNALLSALPTNLRNQVLDKAEPVALPLRFTVERPGERITHVYFPESGIISVVAVGRGDRRCEVGLIGREGATGLPIAHGVDTGRHHVFVQSQGKAFRMSVADYRQALERIPQLQKLMLKYAHVFHIQVSHTALSNAKGSLVQRLARWLVMAQDRMDGDVLVLTHDFLSVMLGVRRPGVTEALHELESKGRIKATRGLVRILDRDGLIDTAAKLYGESEAEYRRQLGAETA